MLDAIYSFDFAVNNFIKDHLVFGFLTPVMKFFSFLGDSGWFWIVTAIILLFFKKTRKIGFTVGAALVLSLIFTNLTLKPLIDRPRPWVYSLEHYGKELLIAIKKPADASFPSGHSSVSFAGAMAIFLRNKKLGIPALAAASLTAYSRLYFFVHYPTDVIAGIILGIAYAAAAFYLINFIYKKIYK